MIYNLSKNIFHHLLFFEKFQKSQNVVPTLQQVSERVRTTSRAVHTHSRRYFARVPADELLRWEKQRFYIVNKPKIQKPYRFFLTFRQVLRTLKQVLARVRTASCVVLNHFRMRFRAYSFLVQDFSVFFEVV